MNYEEMSDFEVNKRVAIILGHRIVNESPTENKGLLVTDTNVGCGSRCGVFDPCNNPLDAWSIIVENDISLIKTNGTSGDTWTCGVANFYDGMWEFDKTKTGECVDFETYGENPLRAAMICFLKMKDAENEPSNSNSTSR